MLLIGSIRTDPSPSLPAGASAGPPWTIARPGERRPRIAMLRGSALILADASAFRGLGPRARRRLGRRLDGLTMVLVHGDGDAAVDDLRTDFPEVLHLNRAELSEPLRRALRLEPAPPGMAEPPGTPSRPQDDLRDRHDRLMRELRMAEQVQRSMLPRTLPSLPGLALGAALRACQHLAGDFYNAFRLDRDRVGFYVGDVMGHGPASALLSVYAMQVIQTKRIEGHSYEILSPSESLAGLNRDLIAGDFPGEPFVTMAYGVLDVPRRRLSYCCAGHPPALLLRPGEPPAELGGGGPLLGVLEEARFETREIDLQAGDRLVLYSDGLDAVHWEDHGRGPSALAARLSERDGRSPQDLIDAAMSTAGLDDWRADDLTMLMAEITE